MAASPHDESTPRGWRSWLRPRASTTPDALGVAKPGQTAKALSAPLGPPAPLAWNLWHLETLKEQSLSVQQREELSCLLFSLRDFAAIDGSLPLQFDSLIRESFGELLALAHEPLPAATLASWARLST